MYANHSSQNVAAVQKRFDALDGGANGEAPHANGVNAVAGIPEASTAEASIAKTDGAAEDLSGDAKTNGTDAVTDKLAKVSVSEDTAAS